MAHKQSAIPPRRQLPSKIRVVRTAVLADASTEEMMLQPSALLAERYDVSLDEVEAARRKVARARSPWMHSPGLQTVQQLLNATCSAASSSSSSSPLQHVHPRQCIPTGLEPLNSWLLGGLRPGIVCDLAGAPGVGKTSLAMQMAAQCLASSSTAHVVWLSSVSPHEDLANFQRWAPSIGASHDESRLHLLHVADLDVCTHQVLLESSTLRQWLRQHRHASPPHTSPLLMIIDSLSQLAQRSDGEETLMGIGRSGPHRQLRLMTLMNGIKTLAEMCAVAVVLVTDDRSPRGIADGTPAELEVPRIELGAAYRHAVNVALVMRVVASSNPRLRVRSMRKVAANTEVVVATPRAFATRLHARSQLDAVVRELYVSKSSTCGAERLFMSFADDLRNAHDVAVSDGSVAQPCWVVVELIGAEEMEMWPTPLAVVDLHDFDAVPSFVVG